jgi:hypothetical protein
MECWARSEALALLWNDGFKKNKTQSANYCIAFVVLMAYFMG